jgi:hypothetical protein
MITRRHLLKNTGLFRIMGASFGVKVFAGKQGKKKVLRFVHLSEPEFTCLMLYRNHDD